MTPASSIRLRVVLAVALSTSAACSSRIDDAGPPGGDSGSTQSGVQVTANGIGPVKVGMSVASAEAALRTSLAAPVGSDSSGCRYATWSGGPPGVRLMIERNEIVRIDVDSAAIPTSAGARVGDSEDRIEALYRGRVVGGPHKYTDGHFLTVTPADVADSAFRLIFETDGKQVTRYRVGQRPQVEYVEGCG